MIYKYQSPVAIPVPDTPQLIMSPNSLYIQSTTQLALRCATTSAGDKTYTFFRNGQLVDTGDNNYMIASASVSDSGSYTCAVTINGVASLQSNFHTINVVGKIICVRVSIVNHIQAIYLKPYIHT